MEITQEQYFQLTVELMEEGFITAVNLPTDAIEVYTINKKGWERFGLKDSDWKDLDFISFTAPMLHLNQIKNFGLRSYLKKLYSGNPVEKYKATLLTALYSNAALNL